MDQTTFIGASGAFIILLAFILLQVHKWKEDYFIYDFFNLVGGLLLVIYALLLSSYPFLILNAVWAALSLRDVIFDLQRNSKRKDTKHFISKWLQ